MLLLFATVIEAKTPDEPYKFFREVVGLNEEQISAIRSGKAVAEVVESPTRTRVTPCLIRYLRRTAVYIAPGLGLPALVKATVSQ